jgi:hypothetical protein
MMVIGGTPVSLYQDGQFLKTGEAQKNRRGSKKQERLKKNRNKAR